jgi:hypothetical protein
MWEKELGWRKRMVDGTPSVAAVIGLIPILRRASVP